MAYMAALFVTPSVFLLALVHSHSGFSLAEMKEALFV
jgi:hypothetical protein